jgi:diguanylate cyclase (GGDEF)-like protein
MTKDRHPPCADAPALSEPGAIPCSMALKAFRNLKTPVWVFDVDHKRVAWANDAALEVWQAKSEAELYARDMGKDMSSAVAQRLNQYKEDFIRAGATFSEVWTLYPNGEPRSSQMLLSGIRMPDGRMAICCEAIQQVDHQPETARSIDALLHTSVMITLAGFDGQVLYRNPAARASAPDLGQTLQERFAENGTFETLVDAINNDGESRILAEALTAKGPRWHEFTARQCRDSVTGQSALLVSEVDITELKQAERRASYLAEHDTLTRLANRATIVETGKRWMLRRSKGAPREMALLFIDLDRFKIINDTLGHNIGDGVLVEAARRISSVVRRRDVVGRLGGDEFVVLLGAEEGTEIIDTIAARLLKTLSAPMRVEQHEILLTASVGISHFPAQAGSFEDLMKNADIAMYSAKASGKNRFARYCPTMADAAREKLALEVDLRHAVENGALEVHFQPRVCVQSNRIVGAEALVRWCDPHRGMVSPAVFIPIAEEIGLIEEIGKLVVARAVRQQVLWRAAGYRLSMAINVSAREFANAATVAEMIELVHENGGEPRDIELEITESLLLSNDTTTHDILMNVSACGFSIAIDDFGTGYSNLAYMQQYPINCLKIDRSFIKSLDTKSAIAEMIISMCKLMKLRIVAEGVETPEQLAWLKSRGCEEYQGFLFAAALPAAAFTARLEEEAQPLHQRVQIAS